MSFQTFIVSVILLLFAQLKAQEPVDTFQLAKQQAYEGKYVHSIFLLSQKTDLESRQFLARVYAWSLDYEKSISLCQELIQQYPKVVSHYQIAATTALWGGEWSACYEYAEQGIKNGGDSISFQLLQLKALVGNKKWTDAKILCDDLKTKMPASKELEQIVKQVLQAQFQKELSLTQLQDFFTVDSSRWRNTSISLRNKTKYGPLLVSAHQSNRFEQTGLQGELEFYPKIDSNYYAYLNLGISSSVLFPRFRNGISLFRSFNKGLEVELGYRNLQFEEVGQVWFYLSSLTRYFGNNSLAYRFTSIHSPEGRSVTHGIKFTRYFGAYLSFWSIELGSGTNARDYQNYSSLQAFSNINSKRIQVDYKQFLNYRTAVKLTTAFETATYREDQEGLRYTLGIELNYQF